MDTILFCVIGACLITLCFVWILFHKVSRLKVADERVEEISSYIKEGAMAFLLREYKIIIPFMFVFAIFLTILGFIPSLKNAEGVGWQSAICFVIGGLFSGAAGYIGMRSAIKANARTTMKAKEEGMNGALNVAFSGGSVLGLSVCGIGLLGLTTVFFIFYKIFGLQTAVHVVSGYSLGCSMIALFARVGGGIYTKAADVGADLVGKVETGIPEDDPRNPAVIADNVGDNVGDIAGMGSDLCESYVGSLVSALSISLMAGLMTEGQSQSLAMFIFIIAGMGAIASVLSVIFVKIKKWNNPKKALDIATYFAVGIVVIGSLLLSILFLDKEINFGSTNEGIFTPNATFSNVGAFIAIVVGLIAGVLVGVIAEIYTSGDKKQVKEVANQSRTGHATNIIAGFSLGMESTAPTIIVLVLAIIIAYVVFGNLGIGLAAVGMLSTVGITVSVDAYGPISDNAGGIAEMANMPDDVREITDHLDAVGNTTAAIGKGFCIGSATLTSVALFVAYSASTGATIKATDPIVIAGILIGSMLPYLFSSLVIRSVGKAANKMIDEVRSQFKADPGIMAGTSKPNYARCVDISTKAALKEMILPGVIAVSSPIAAAFILGKDGLGGLLVGGLVSAIMLAVFMANAGGAWDNAKKYIEQGNLGGKGSETHKAAVTGDTVGDPFKDTAGPAMDILIKMMSVIALILAPILASDGFQSLWEILTKK